MLESAAIRAAASGESPANSSTGFGYRNQINSPRSNGIGCAPIFGVYQIRFMYASGSVWIRTLSGRPHHISRGGPFGVSPRSRTQKPCPHNDRDNSVILINRENVQ